MVLQTERPTRSIVRTFEQVLKKPASVVQSSRQRKSAGGIRSALPKLWRHFSTGTEKAALTFGGLQAWLRKEKGAHASLGQESKASLQEALREAAQMPCLSQRLGVRFKDPTGGGTWGVDNLVGYSTASVSSTAGQRTEVSWGSYVVTFQLRLSGKSSLEIERSSKISVLSSDVEMCPRGGQPLVQGEMITVTPRSLRRKRKKVKVVRCRADLLPAVIYRSVQPSRVPRWTLIYLHGFADSAFGNYANTPHFFLDGSIALKIVVPTAPSRELSIFDSWWLEVKGRSTASGASSCSKWRLKQFNAWFDYLTNNDGKGEDTVDPESLEAMQKVLHKLIWREAAELEGHTDRVIIGGKSQGCIMALDAALTFPRRLGGFIGVVGHLLSSTPVEPDGPQVKTPLHFFHEVEDHLMKWAWVQRGVQRLKSAGYNVYSRRSKDPEGHGHYVGGGFEGRQIRQALQSICSAKM